MAISQFRARRKITGGMYRKKRKKVRNRGGISILVGIGTTKRKVVRGRAGNTRLGLLSNDVVNAYDPKIKKYVKAKIEAVIESPSNRNYIRRNIMTKGSIIKTDKGNARITSRPGQEGSLNAVLLGRK
mgnify:CR=1 FL=1